MPGEPANFLQKKGLQGIWGAYILLRLTRGRSSGVERHVANVNVVSSNLIARCSSFPKDGDL